MEHKFIENGNEDLISIKIDGQEIPQVTVSLIKIYYTKSWLDEVERCI